MSSDGFKFKKEYEIFFKLNWLDRYEVLRVITKIEFMDYNLLEVNQSFYIQDNYKSISKINGEEIIIDTSFFALPETYNTNEILMHNTSAYINDKQVAITESSKLNLIKLNNLNIMYSSMNIINYVKQTIESELKNFSNKLSKEDLINDLEMYRNSLIVFFQSDSKFSQYLEDVNTASKKFEEKFSSLEEADEKLNWYIERLNKLIKKVDYNQAEILSRIIYRLDMLLEQRFNQLIAINLPKRLYENGDILDSDNHFTIKLHSEELYKQFLREKKLKKLSFLIGQRVDFFMVLYTYDWGSGYYEIKPPQNTRITKVERYQHPRFVSSKYLMETKKSREANNKSIEFEDKFNERLVIHIGRVPEEIKKEIKDLWNRPAPTISFRLSPHLALQAWICFTICLGIFFSGFLGFILGILCLIENTSSLFPVLEELIGFSTYQAFWIFGLIIGNQLWLKEPKFLWKYSTWVSMFMVLIGFSLMVLNIYIINIK